jgi:hypothetical protein
VDLALLGWTSEKCAIMHQKKGFTEISIFDWWFENIFVDEVNRRGLYYDYEGPAFLILD